MSKRPRGTSHEKLNEIKKKSGWTWKYWPSRCNQRECQARRTLKKHPDEYVRGKPKCHIPGCSGRMYLDTYRATKAFRKHDVGEVCKCHMHRFPHAKGRGYCLHNPNGKEDDRGYKEQFDPAWMDDFDQENPHTGEEVPF